MSNQTNNNVILIKNILKEWDKELPDSIITYMATNIQNKNILPAVNKIITFLELTKISPKKVDFKNFFKEFS